jgi:probable HAF family extracellular repeat protein
VVGYSYPAGSSYGRAFLWQDGTIQDLGGAPPGTCTFAFAVNEAGQAAGGVCVGPYFHAALWTGIGQFTDLGTLAGDPCSNATDINAMGQVVGGAQSLAECLGAQEATDAFLWEHGSIVDLNALIPPNSPLHLVFPDHINNQGEISGDGTDASGNNHAFLLIPCDAGHPFIEGCDYGLVDMSNVARPAVAPSEGHATPMVWGPANALNHERSLLGLSWPSK